MYNLSKLTVIVFCLISMGCSVAPINPIPLSENFYANDESKIGVYLDELPEADKALPGASCLLCYAVASAANGALTDHIRTLSTDEMLGIDKSIETILVSKGLKSSIISDDIDLDKLPKYSSNAPEIAKLDYKSLQDKLGLDKLILIDINTMGYVRPYSSYISVGEPTGSVLGTVYIVDLATNTYELYEPLKININAEGEWDEPPSFPGITTAHYQAIEIAKSKILSIFTK